MWSGGSSPYVGLAPLPSLEGGLRLTNTLGINTISSISLNRHGKLLLCPGVFPYNVRCTHRYEINPLCTSVLQSWNYLRCAAGAEIDISQKRKNSYETNSYKMTGVGNHNCSSMFRSCRAFIVSFILVPFMDITTEACMTRMLQRTTRLWKLLEL